MIRLFGLGLKDIISGVATGVGFALGGPVGGALVGGAVGGVIAMTEGKGWEDVLESTLVNGALGAIPGSLVGGAAKDAMLSGGMKLLGRSFRDAGTLLTKKGFGGLGTRLGLLRPPMARLGLGSLTAGVATAYGGKAWGDSHQKPAPAELPTIIIR